MSGFDDIGTEAAGVLLNTIVEDTHIETEPEIAPATSADAKPVIVDTSGDYPEVLPESDNHGQSRSAPAKRPLPDLRHEQTYLAAINRTNGTYLSIARVTILDFLLWPTITQFAYVLGLNGFKYLREGSSRSGRKFGEIIRDFLNIGGVLD
jgi:hypothetical protein